MALNILAQITTATVYLYLLALTTSIAGMEAFSWLTAIIVLLMYLVDHFGEKTLPRFRLPGDLFLWGFWLVVTLGALLIPDISGKDQKYMISNIRWVLLIYAFSYLLSFKFKSLKKYLPVLFGFAGLVAIYAIVQVPTGLELAREVGNPKNRYGDLFRAHGFFYSTMTYSYSFGMLFCFMLASWIYKVFDGWVGRFLVPITTTVVGISLILSFTRGLWIALAAAVFVMLFSIKRKFGYMLIVAGSVLVVLAMIFSPIVRDRITSIGDFNNSSNLGRIHVWQGNWAMFLDNPVLGVGHRRNTEMLPVYYEKIGLDTSYVSNAHNTYLQVLGGTGLLGLLSYCGFMFVFMMTAFRLWKNSTEPLARSIGLGAIGGMVCLHVGGLTQVNFFDGEVTHVFVFTTACLLATYFHYVQNRKELGKDL